MQVQYIVQSCWLLASFPKENGSSTGFSQGIASLFPPPIKQQKPGAFEKAWQFEQRNMWKVSLPGVWHLKSTSRIIPGVFHPHRSPCTCSFTRDTLCQSLTFLKAPGSLFLSPVQGACSDTLHVSTLLFIPNSQSVIQPSWFSHKPSSHTLGSLHSSMIWGPLKTEVSKWAGVQVASPASCKVVFSQSFSFSEEFYRVLNRTLHKTTSEPPASHQIWQLAGGCTHTNVHTHTKEASASAPFPQETSLK